LQRVDCIYRHVYFVSEDWNQKLRNSIKIKINLFIARCRRWIRYADSRKYCLLWFLFEGQNLGSCITQAKAETVVVSIRQWSASIYPLSAALLVTRWTLCGWNADIDDWMYCIVEQIVSHDVAVTRLEYREERAKARFPLPELTALVDGWPVSITRQHGPCWRPDNSASGNRALLYRQSATLKFSILSAEVSRHPVMLHSVHSQLWETRRAECW